MLRRAAVPALVFLAACWNPADENEGEASREAPAAPTSFQCEVQARVRLAPVERAAATVPDVAVVAGAATPSIASVSPAAVVWGEPVSVEGSALGDGTSGEYVSVGTDVGEVRLPACPPPEEPSAYEKQQLGLCASFATTRVSFVVPLGAAGEVTVHTTGGAAKAAVVAPAWTSSPSYRAERRVRVVAVHAFADVTYALVTEDASAGDALRPPTLLSFRDGVVSSATLGALGPSAGELAAFVDAGEGTVDLAIFASVRSSEPRLQIVHIRGDDVEIDGPCLPPTLALALAPGPTGLVAFTHDTKRRLVRMTYAREAKTWRIDGGPFEGAVSGHGVALADGSVTFAWSEKAGGVFDDKAQARLAYLAPGASSFERHDLTEVVDDYVSVQPFATASGVAVGHCSIDDTGLFADKGLHGSHCHLEELVSGERRAVAGYPATLPSGYSFAYVGERVVALRASGDGLFYEPSPADPATTIARSSVTGAFVRGRGDVPAIVLTMGSAVAIASLPPP